MSSRQIYDYSNWDSVSKCFVLVVLDSIKEVISLWIWKKWMKKKKEEYEKNGSGDSQEKWKAACSTCKLFSFGRGSVHLMLPEHLLLASCYFSDFYLVFIYFSNAQCWLAGCCLFCRGSQALRLLDCGELQGGLQPFCCQWHSIQSWKSKKRLEKLIHLICFNLFLFLVPNVLCLTSMDI